MARLPTCLNFLNEVPTVSCLGSFLAQRSFSFSVVRSTARAGKYKTTRKRTRPLTYEMAFKPDQIGVKKSWLTWHTSNLEQIGLRSAQTAAEDEIIRRLVRGLWPEMFASELVIKRRGNIIILVGIVERRISSAKMIWLIGFTEELLSLTLKQPVKMELQTIEDKSEIVFKYI